jgi:hypothetical protein
MPLLGYMFDLTIGPGGPCVSEWRHSVSDMGLERPVADSVEQGRDVIADRTEPDDYGRPREVPLEANEADAAEQERALGHDEDDYR